MQEDTRSDAIFWVSVDRIKPNPYQPRREFNDEALAHLSDSIRQYGVLQPLVVIRKESEIGEGGMKVEYELIAGERRLRASKLAGIEQVPVIIRPQEESNRTKLELALIENIQREDLNPVDRARAFHTLSNDFDLKHIEIAGRIGKSREYVSNSIRILALPDTILKSLLEGNLNEGHARTLLMLSERPEEQDSLYKEIMDRKLTVREAERISRRGAKDKVRKKDKIFDRETFEIEERLAETLGTRVHIEKRDLGGKIMIEFFTPEDLQNILNSISNTNIPNNEIVNENTSSNIDENDEDIYSVKNFSL